jgi:hypothetical protein
MEPDVVQRCGLNYDMDTDNRGTINPAERGNLMGSWETLEHPPGTNAFTEPDSMYDAGGCDPSNGV